MREVQLCCPSGSLLQQTTVLRWQLHLHLAYAAMMVFCHIVRFCVGDEVNCWIINYIY